MWLTYSVLAALFFGSRGILYHWTSQQPINRNLLLFGTFSMGFVISLVCALLFGSNWTLSALIGIQMGLFSFGANAAMFKGFAVGKASIIAILTALPSVIVVIIAFFLWNERLNWMQLSLFIVIVSGILLVRYSNDISLKNLQGAQWGVIALLLFAFNDLSGKWSTIMLADQFLTLVFMFGTGSICFALWWLRDVKIERAKRSSMINDSLLTIHGKEAAVEVAQHTPQAAALETPEQWSNIKTYLIGMGVGITNVLGMIFIISAFEVGKAGLVSAVTALNVLIVLLYTRFVVKDKFTRVELAGIALAFIGILLMRLFGS